VTAADHVKAAIQRMEAGRFDDAEPELRKALEIDAENVTAWSNLATVLLRRNDLDGAEHAARESLRRTPSATAERTLARPLYQRGARSEALEHLQAAIALAPSALDLHEKAGLIASEIGRFDVASRELAIVAAARPDDEPLQARLAATLRGLAFEELR